MNPSENHTTSTPFEPDSSRAAIGLLAIGWKQKWLVILGVVSALALGALFYAQEPPVYRSSAQVMVIKKHPDDFHLPGLDFQRVAFEADYVASHIILIRSPLI